MIGRLFGTQVQLITTAFNQNTDMFVGLFYDPINLAMISASIDGFYFDNTTKPSVYSYIYNTKEYKDLDVLGFVYSDQTEKWWFLATHPNSDQVIEGLADEIIIERLQS